MTWNNIHYVREYLNTAHVEQPESCRLCTHTLCIINTSDVNGRLSHPGVFWSFRHDRHGVWLMVEDVIEVGLGELLVGISYLYISFLYFIFYICFLCILYFIFFYSVRVLIQHVCLYPSFSQESLSNNQSTRLTIHRYQPNCVPSCSVLSFHQIVFI
jgi:hypothetical protein